jgi:hypothetical protein
MKNKLVKLGVAATLSASVGAMAHAATVDLGFIVDRSGSVGETNYDNTMAALKTALNAIDVTGDTKYAISIVTFSGTNASNDATTVVADNILLDSAAAKTTLNTAIDAAITGTQIASPGNLTNYELAFEAMAALGTSGDVSILNFATDGAPTEGDSSLGSLADEIAALQTAGWDAMNVEAIGSGIAGSSLLQGLGFDTQITPGWDPDTDDIADFFVAGTLANGNCSGITSSAQIVNPISNCFVIDTTFADLPDAFNTKIAATVDLTGGDLNPIPVPATLPLIVAGFGMLGFAARRRRKSA